MDWQELIPSNTLITFLEDIQNPQHNIDIDNELGDAVARGEQPPLIRIWRSAMQEGIAVSRRDVATAQAQETMASFAKQGLPIVVRQTGGTAVPQGPGVLHLSYLLPRQARSVTTDDYYRLLCFPVIDWLSTLCVTAETGALPGSYCDGTYNILADGRKLVGTAQAWRGGLAGTTSRHPGYILAHANLIVAYDLSVATERINRFYEQSGNSYRVDVATSTTLTQLVPSWYPTSPPETQAFEAALSLAGFLRQVFSL